MKPTPLHLMTPPKDGEAETAHDRFRALKPAKGGRGHGRAMRDARAEAGLRRSVGSRQLRRRMPTILARWLGMSRGTPSGHLSGQFLVPLVQGLEAELPAMELNAELINIAIDFGAL